MLTATDVFAPFLRKVKANEPPAGWAELIRTNRFAAVDLRGTGLSVTPTPPSAFVLGPPTTLTGPAATVAFCKVH